MLYDADARLGETADKFGIVETELSQDEVDSYLGEIEDDFANISGAPITVDSFSQVNEIFGGDADDEALFELFAANTAVKEAAVSSATPISTGVPAASVASAPPMGAVSAPKVTSIEVETILPTKSRAVPPKVNTVKPASVTIETEVQVNKVKVGLPSQELNNLFSLKHTSGDGFQPLYSGEGRRTIGVGSLWSGAGSTFAIANLARLLSTNLESVSVTECPGVTPALLSYLTGDLKPPAGWNSLLSGMQEEVGPSNYWKQNNLALFPLNYTDEGVLRGEDLKSFLGKVQVAQYNFIDFSTLWQSEKLESLYSACDEIWIFVKPVPHQMTRGFMELKTTLSNHMPKVKFIGSMMDSWTSQRTNLDAISSLLVRPRHDFLSGGDVKPSGLVFSSTIPTIDPSLVSKSVWRGQFLCDLPEAYLKGRKPFDGLVDLLGALTPQHRIREGV